MGSHPWREEQKEYETFLLNLEPQWPIPWDSLVGLSDLSYETLWWDSGLLNHFGKCVLSMLFDWYGKINNTLCVSLCSSLISQSKVVEETMGILLCMIPPNSACSRYSVDSWTTPNSKNFLQILDSFLSSCWWKWMGKHLAARQKDTWLAISLFALKWKTSVS